MTESTDMSTHRTNPNAGYADTSKLPKGPNGRNLCRRCSTEVPKGRSTFCSKACVEAWRLTTDTAFLRRQVYKRDKGVCRACGMNTKKFEAALETIRREAVGINRVNFPGLLGLHGEILKILRVGRHRDSLWDADHKVEVVKGGGECSLDGMQTLCLWCHRAKTARLAAELAAQRSHNTKS